MSAAAAGLLCDHCGEECSTANITAAGKQFCCTGCKMVFELLHTNGLCNYYQLNQNPGINQRQPVRKNKFAFLDEPAIQQKLTCFNNDRQTHVQFYLPQMHCSSCLYLLENLHKLAPGVISARVHFGPKKIDIIFDHNMISLRQTAELLTSIGYEPYISQHDTASEAPATSKKMLYRLGVAGFCFGNIMLLSFPEYLGIGQSDQTLLQAFRFISVLLSLPVVFFSAVPFIETGWRGIRQRFLNIDAPVALAVLVTFVRSLCEVFSGSGSGYFDSMSGIVFFMLAGRVLQTRTYDQLAFDRDYTSYFPIAITVIKNDREVPTMLPGIKPGDTLRLHHGEVIPADGILTKGTASIDYSFVTGETAPVQKTMGELVYAGGRQQGVSFEMLVVKAVSQSYLTGLWSSFSVKKTTVENTGFVNVLSRWFTAIVLLIAVVAAAYWWHAGAGKVLNVITAVLIVACPCALLLAESLTNGNVLRILSRNQFYLRDAGVISRIAGINHIVFDKTGTLTTAKQQDVRYTGKPLSELQHHAIAAIAAQSQHPLSRAVAASCNAVGNNLVQAFRETPGYGIEGFAGGMLIAIGSLQYITGKQPEEQHSACVHVAIEGKYCGFFEVQNQYRVPVTQLAASLKAFGLSVISGDHSKQRSGLKAMMGQHATVLFNQSPEDKLNYIKWLQQMGWNVMMTGDGLNDAGALLQSNAGIAVTDDCNNFTPASDAVLQADHLQDLRKFIALCRSARYIITGSFILSVIYNITGIYFAVQGSLSPLVAAVLMPASSFTMLLISWGCSRLAAKWLRLQ